MSVFDKYLSREQVALEVDAKPREVDAWIREGRLPAYRLPTGVVMVRRVDLECLLEKVPVEEVRR